MVWSLEVEGLMGRNAPDEKSAGGWPAKGEATGRIFAESESRLKANGRLVVKRRRTRERSHSARIRSLYRQIQGLILAGASDEAIDQKRQELRRFQQLEAKRMTRQAERRSHLAAGKGYELLEKAARLLAK